MLNKLLVYLFVLLIPFFVKAQNDLDALRYSRYGVNGTSRFTAMGGAFGAVGADVSCASFNPAGLALFRKGDVALGLGLRVGSFTTDLYNNKITSPTVNFVFNNFGIATVLKDNSFKKNNRNILAYSQTQHQNFNTTYEMGGNTNNSSIAKDMLNIAVTKGSNPGNLNQSYEGLGFNNLLLDTVFEKYYSFVDLKRTVKQSRSINLKGKQAERNISYAYSGNDDFYFGISLGIPKVEYESTITHTEADEKDSMRIVQTSPTNYSTTYTSAPPEFNDVYRDYLGFNSLTYTEYFKTTGNGFNLKIGGIFRAAEFVRLGAYVHSPTILNLTDVYYNELSTSWDKQLTNPIIGKVPENGGTYKYVITTPGRFGLCASYIYKKFAVFALDYESTNYGRALITSSDGASVFAGVNAVIKNKYKRGHNIRAGAEFNIKPVFIRLGYNYQSSPFGLNAGNNLARHIPSVGIGFKNEKGMYIDFHYLQLLGREDYFLFSTLDTKTNLNFAIVNLGVTAGIKF